jgi:hypothetical protein
LYANGFLLAFGVKIISVIILVTHQITATEKCWMKTGQINRSAKALLDALPADRMIQVRTPQMKQRAVYGVNAATNSAAITDGEAFTETMKTRIGMQTIVFWQVQMIMALMQIMETHLHLEQMPMQH